MWYICNREYIDNNMIHEQYVSFETAKLLKKNRFDIPLNYYYNSNGRRGYSSSYNWNETDEEYSDYSCPTQAMTMKWLREEKNIAINIWYDGEVWSSERGWISTDDGDFVLVGHYGSYEEACEEAIKYCLKNLIK